MIDVLSIENPTELWDAEYKRKEGFYEHKKGKTKLVKKVVLSRTLPMMLLRYRVTTSYNKKINFGTYLMFKASDSGYEHVFYFVRDKGYGCERYHKPVSPWISKKVLSFHKTGSFIYFNESKKVGFMLCADKRDIEVVEFFNTLNGPEVLLLFKRKEIKQDKLVNYNILIIPGEDYHVDSKVTAVFLRENKKVLFFARSSEILRKVVFEVREKTCCLEVKRKNIEGIGDIF